MKKLAPKKVVLTNTNECKDLLDEFTLLDTSFVFVQIVTKKENNIKKTKGGLF